jgi:DNA invertase Pin-like site-specific DNA recombinase
MIGSSLPASTSRFIACERVFTTRQRQSVPGFEAQRKSVQNFAASRGAEALFRFTEAESGKHAKRSELQKALHLAKVTGATLVIAPSSTG